MSQPGRFFWSHVGSPLIRVFPVSTNGNRKPPRARIELVAGNPSEAEGAAVVAALECFLAETAPTPVVPQVSPWQRAALCEAVSRNPDVAFWGAVR